MDTLKNHLMEKAVVENMTTIMATTQQTVTRMTTTLPQWGPTTIPHMEPKPTMLRPLHIP